MGRVTALPNSHNMLQNKWRDLMTILVAYVPRPEGQAALDKGIEVAQRRNEKLVVVNATSGGKKEDASFADVQDFEPCTSAKEASSFLPPEVALTTTSFSLRRCATSIPLSRAA